MPLMMGVPGCCDCSFPRTVTVTSACGGLIAGALVELVDGLGNVIDSCTTNGSGVCVVSGAGTVTLRVTASRHNTFTTSISIVVAGSNSVTMAIDSTNYVCCSASPQPVPKVLNGSDKHGSFTLTMTSVPFLEWTGCRDLAASTVAACDAMTLVCSTAGSGTGSVVHKLTCFGGMVNGSLIVSWLACNVPGVGNFPVASTCASPGVGACGVFSHNVPLNAPITAPPLLAVWRMSHSATLPGSVSFYEPGDLITITE